ncbi:hypothetical protein ACN20G_17005 [Streptomyces sp. BI20]|uniref:hypothetical protein n=1 Tax=Streptomyces sp. BI20 TaxID=3403460 RepID=UPI003C77CB9A
MSVFIDLVSWLAGLVEPATGAFAGAAAIVLFTVLVRLALHPLARVAARSARPAVALLTFLPQIPLLWFLYRAFSETRVDGAPNPLLEHGLFAAPLSGTWGEALSGDGPFGPAGLVFLGLFAVVAAVASWSALHGRRMAQLRAELPPTPLPGGKRPTPEQEEVMRRMTAMAPKLALLSFGTLISVAIVPLAAGLYLMTTSAWAIAERTLLDRRWPPAERARIAAEARARAGAGDTATAGAKAKAKAEVEVGGGAVVRGDAGVGVGAEAAGGDTGGARSVPAGPGTRTTKAQRARAARARANAAARGSGAGADAGAGADVGSASAPVSGAARSRARSRARS